MCAPRLVSEAILDPVKLATVVKKRIKEVNREREREGGKRRGKDGDGGKEEEGWENSSFPGRAQNHLGLRSPHHHHIKQKQTISLIKVVFNTNEQGRKSLLILFSH